MSAPAVGYTLCLSLGGLLLGSLFGCKPAVAPDTRAADEKTIRGLDAQWSKDAGAHDLMGTLSFYADNAVLLPPDEVAAADKEAIRASWANTFLTLDGLSWEVTRLDVARSGDLAYLTGKWKGEMRAPVGGASVAVTGKLLEVWRKQSDGAWKCVADTYNNDPPKAPVLTK
jgi:ketosteroid isomerase-like protein